MFSGCPKNCQFELKIIVLRASCDCTRCASMIQHVTRMMIVRSATRLSPGQTCLCQDVPLSSREWREVAKEPDQESEAEWSASQSSWQHKEETQACLVLFHDGVCCAVSLVLCRAARLTPSWEDSRVQLYHEAAGVEGTIHHVAYSTFCYLWQTLVPSVVMRPRSDLCRQCQQNSAAIVRMANGLEAEKKSAISDALEHLRIVKMERA